MDVTGWLRAIGLEKYEPAFIESAIDFDILPELTEADLEKLGMVLGDRKRCVSAIKALARNSPSADTGRQADELLTDHPPLAAAERRHLTVMICDLVGSTDLSSRLDPEDMGAVIDAFQAACARITLAFDGFLADFRGDGILAYFGYPRAHEDDAERTVRAGLDIVAAVTRLKTPAGEPLSVRVGIATGLVVVGQRSGAGAVQEHSVIGDAPSLAARLQSLAKPGTVVVAASTRRLLGDLFTLRDLGFHKIKDIAEPVPVWVVDSVSSTQSRFEAIHATSLTNLVGRERELDLLLKWHRLAWKGEGKVVLILGESGIGKSRLLAVLEQRIAEPHTLLRYQCSPHHEGSVLYPFIVQLERAAQFKIDDTPEERLNKLNALLSTAVPRPQETVRLLATLLSIPSGARYPKLELRPTQQRGRTFAALLHHFESLARQKPMLLLFEDMHWADATSLELLDLIVARVRQLPVLALFTSRPDFEPSFARLPNVTTLTLGRLSRDEVETIVTQVAGGCSLPADVMNQITAKTDGNPLFVEELTKAVLEANILVKDGSVHRLKGPLPPLAIPSTLHDSLMARLDRLAPVKEIGQIGATIGREFSYSLMREVGGRDEPSLKRALAKLEQAELLFRRGELPEATYSFKHALVRDAAYESLLKSRRQQLHGQIARVMEEKFPDIVASQPEILAHHFTEAGLVQPATNYWLKAGNLALSHSANAAINHLEHGLKLIPGIDNPMQRAKFELLLQTSLGNSLRATNGWSSDVVKNAYTRALELCKESGLDEHTFAAAFGLWTWNFLRASLGEARGLAEYLRKTADDVGNQVYLVLAHEALGFSLFAQGDFASAHAEMERSISFWDSSNAAAYLDLSAQDPRVHVQSYDAIVLWCLGFPDQALRLSAEARHNADRSELPFSRAIARTIGLRVHQLRGEADAVANQANETIALCEEHEFAHYLAMALILRGWAIAQRGEFDKGTVEIQNGLERERSIGASLFETYSMGLLADACLTNKRYKEALDFLQQAQLRLDEADSGRYYEAEIYRLLGKTYLQLNKDLDQAENYFSKGLKIAREQKARSFELRLLLDICDLRDVRQNADFYSELGHIYGCFSEGLNTTDLLRAKAKLQNARRV